MYQKPQSYDVCFLRHGVRQTEFFVILDHFLPFYPSKDPQNQNFEKMKKTPEDIIVLQLYTINDSYMMSGSWDMECNGQNVLSFWTIFCPFTSLTTQKIKILKRKQMKKLPGDIIILYRCNINDMMYGSWDTKQSDRIFLPFWTIFRTPSPLPLTTQKIKKILKNEKITWRNYHFAQVYHKLQSHDAWFLRYGAWQNVLSFWTFFCPFMP